MSKLHDYLKAQKIDPRRVLNASKTLEALRPEDRAHKLLHKKSKGGDEKAKEALAGKERRSGRALSNPTFAAALKGETVSGPAKTRILRAVNSLLEAKKKPAIAIKDLF